MEFLICKVTANVRITPARPGVVRALLQRGAAVRQLGAYQIEVRRTAWDGKRGSGTPSHRPSSASGGGDAGPPPLVLASAADSSRFEERRRLVKIEMGGLSMLDEYAAVERAGRSPRLASSELLRRRASPRDWIERESEAY